MVWRCLFSRNLSHFSYGTKICYVNGISYRKYKFSNTTSLTNEGVTSRVMNTLSIDQVLDTYNNAEIKDKYRQVYESLRINPEVSISYNNFISVCNNLNLDENDSINLLHNLNNSGLIMFNGKNLPIITQPQLISDTLHNILDLNNEYKNNWIMNKKKLLFEYLNEIEPLEIKYLDIEKQAINHSKNVFRLCFFYIIGQCLVIPYLTFWYLSWDIMEPVTYMLNLWTLFAGFWFYIKTGGDFSYDAIEKAIVTGRKLKLFKKNNFNMELYESLRDKIAVIEDDLLNPEWERLRDVHPKIPDPIKQIHLSPLELLKNLKDEGYGQ